MDIENQMEQDAAEERERPVSNSLTVLGQQAWELEIEIAEAEAEVKRLNKKLEKLMKHSIPTALSEAGVDEFGFENAEGNMCRIGKEMKVRGTLSDAEDIDDALAYLESSGLRGVAKTKVELDFNMDQEQEADNLAVAIDGITGRRPMVTKTIHPQTLIAFVRSKLKEDSTFDFEKVGCTAYPQAKFTKRR